MFWPKYKKWEGKWSLLVWQWFQWHLRNHLFPPLHLFPHSSRLGQSQGTPQASLCLLLSCHRAGRLMQLAGKTSTACRGQEVREPAELLRDVGPVERQASLEYTEVGNFYICLRVYICGPSCRVYICVDHLRGPCCRDVCVSMLSICVQQQSLCSREKKMLFKVKGFTLLVSVMAIWVRS